MSTHLREIAELSASECSLRKRRAFTLIELLTVMAVLAVMAVAMVPAFNSIKGAGDVTKAVYDVSGIMEQARAYAMANNTYVFVGFAERDGSNPSAAGVGQILVAVMGARDGTRSFGTDNANLVPLTKLRRIENMHFEDSLPNTGAMSRPVVQDAYRIGNSSCVAEDTFEVSGYVFSKIIQFDPRGMAGIQSGTTANPQWMEIGLVGARGNVATGAENGAVVILDGVTGSAKIYRP